jgi:Na+/H+ antiporter NhaD/arsenite permease-like protein
MTSETATRSRLLDPRAVLTGVVLALVPLIVFASRGEPPSVFGIPVEFLLFATTLLAVALLHHRTLEVALAGLTVITLYKLFVTGFHAGPGLPGLAAHLSHEWVVLTNLFGLLMGFALLSKHFEESRVPEVLPNYLADDWKGGLTLLAVVFVMSGFLDNIAAAIIGGTVAASVFRGRVHIGYLAAIVAASNAGGAGSVVGDTTTTMMWIDGVNPLDVVHAYLAAVVAFVIFAVPAARVQHRYSPIVRDAPADISIDWTRVAIVVFILAAAIVTNVTVNLRFPELSDRFPFLGAAVWIALVAATPLRSPDWSLLPSTAKGSLFLLSLVISASMMPVEKLPIASWQTALGLGFVSSVFDNIPLTKLALVQGGYDWGFLAFAVGFGGSMVWFGSSAGVALSNLFPETRSVGRWIRHGWPIIVGYVIGFFALLLLLGWEAHAPHKAGRDGLEGAAVEHVAH